MNSQERIIKGEDGEIKVFTELYKIFRSHEKWLFAYYNIVVPDVGGIKERQIDMLFICGSGIYVFEVKNYSGTITGDAKEDHLFHNERYCQNPYYQNEFHIKGLSALSLLPIEAFNNVAIFTNSYERLDIKKRENKIFTIFEFSEYLAHLSNSKINKNDGYVFKTLLEAKGIHYYFNEKGPSQHLADLIKTTAINKSEI